MSEDLLLGIDQGSSSTKAVLCTRSGHVIWQDFIPIQTQFLSANEATQDLSEIISSIEALIQGARDNASTGKIVCLGFSFQRSGVGALHAKTKQAQSSLLTWRDRRYRGVIESLSPDQKNEITQRTSLPVLPDYAAAKIAGMQSLFPSPDVLVGTLDSLVLYSLSDQNLFITDDSMASRTLLYDIYQKQYSEQLCRIFNVDQDRLAPICPSLAEHGTINGIPVYCILGDKQASALSEHFSHGILNLNFGTTSSLSLDIGSKLIVREGFLSNVQFSTSSSYHYFIEGLVNSTGALLEWLAKKRQSKHLLQDMESAYRACASQSLPIFYFPLRGIGSPFWQYDLPSIATQLPKPNTDVFLASCVEHIAFSISSLILQLRATAGIPSIELLQVSGGLSEITTLVQLISNITKLPCKVHLTASSALGAARAYELHHQAGKENRLQSPPEVFPKAHGELQDRFDTWKVMEKALLDRTHSQFSVIPL